MNLEYFAAGFFGPLSLWTTVLVVASIWSFGKRIMKG